MSTLKLPRVKKADSNKVAKRKKLNVPMNDNIVVDNSALVEEVPDVFATSVDDTLRSNRPSLLTTTSVRKRVAASTKKPRKNQRVVSVADSATSATIATNAASTSVTAEENTLQIHANTNLSLDPLQEYAVPLADIILATTKYPRRCMRIGCQQTTWLCSRDTVIECSDPKCQYPVLYKPRHMTIETYDADF